MTATEEEETTKQPPKQQDDAKNDDANDSSAKKDAVSEKKEGGGSDVKAAAGPAPAPAVILPTPYDVLLGRGKPFQNHRGNQEMLGLVDMFRPRYQQVDRACKHEIIEQVIQMIRSTGGRFLERVDEFEHSYYTEVTYPVAYRKIGHAFRSNARMRSAERTMAAASRQNIGNNGPPMPMGMYPPFGMMGPPGAAGPPMFGMMGPPMAGMMPGAPPMGGPPPPGFMHPPPMHNGFGNKPPPPHHPQQQGWMMLPDQQQQMHSAAGPEANNGAPGKTSEDGTHDQGEPSGGTNADASEPQQQQEQEQGTGTSND